MYNIIFYKNEVKDYIEELAKRKNTNKEARIKFKKIIAYMDLLAKYGLKLNEPYIKHIENEIWELRPLKDRILFATYENNMFIILNYFVKRTKKTPQNEIVKAKKRLKEYKKWREENG